MTDAAQTIRETLKSVALTCTMPRMIVLKHLVDQSAVHASAQEIHKQLLLAEKSFNLNTIYRVLGDFEKAGLMKSTVIDGRKAIYELNTDKVHYHMLDIETGDVLEFESEKLQKISARIAEEHGFSLIDQQIVLHVRRAESH
ncbi:MAG: transcriptional repressor [Pseudomonadota bacterium]